MVLVSIVMAALTACVLALLCRLTVSALTLTKPSVIQPGSGGITNVSSLGYVYTCSGAEYGHNLDSASCMDALHQIDASSTVEQTYGMRFTGPYDVKLPKRYISGLRSPRPSSSCVQERECFLLLFRVHDVAASKRYVPSD